MMRKHEFYPDFHDLFKYYGDSKIERVRIKNGRTIRRDWFVFSSVNEAMVFFSERCGAFEGRYAGNFVTGKS